MVAGDRLADRIGIGVLAKVFTPELVDRVVEQAGVREQRTRTFDLSAFQARTARQIPVFMLTRQD